MAALNAVDRVNLLEETVMEGTSSDVKALFKEYHEFEFTARALGLAMRFRGLDMTQVLIEGGASLDYVMVRRLYDRYDCGLNAELERGKDYARYLFPSLPISDPYFKKSISKAERLAVMEYLISRNIPSLHSFLYYAVLANDTAVTECLKNHNVDRLPAPYADLVQGLVPPSELERLSLESAVEELDDLLSLHSNDLDLRNVLEQLAKCVPGEISLLRYGLLDLPRICAPGLFVTFCELTSEVRKVDRWRVFRELINQNNASGIDYILKHKWVKNVGDIEFLLQLAREREHDSSEITMLLLETLNSKRSKNTTESDFLSLSEAKPLTLSEARQTWGIKKLEDGNYEVTSYKGTNSQVIVPSKISKGSVVSIAESTFRTDARGIDSRLRASRSSITSVEFPGTLQRIPANLFQPQGAGKNLQTVIIGEGTTEIEEKAFMGLPALNHVTLPASLPDDSPWINPGGSLP